MPRAGPRRPRRRSRPGPLRRRRRRLCGLARAAGGCSTRPRTRSSPPSRRSRSPRSSCSPPSPADDFSFDYVADQTSRELPARLHARRLLERPGGLAAPLAARPDRRCLGRGRAQPPARRARCCPGRSRSSPASRSSSPSCSCFVASPFATQAAPADGAGLNPSLQNPYMIAHPPLLYLGYVGLTIPFAFAMAALASRRVGRALDRRNAALDARRLDVPRRRHPPRRRSGRTRRSAGAAGTRGIPSRTPR